MSGKKADSPPPDKAPGVAAVGKSAKRGKGGARFILLMVILGALAPFGAPTLLVCLGLLPMLIALFTDTDPRKSAFITIGFLNIAGVTPFIIELWQRGQTMEAAMGIMRQPVTWLVMFGAAAIGQLLLYTIPPAMAMMTISRIENRLKTLRDGLKELKAIWGSDVATSKPLELVRKQDMP
jgi:hypothetical protein